MEDKKLKGRGTGGRKGISHKLGPELIEVQDLAKYRIFSQAEIARQYGISRARVSQVAREAQNK
jgi:predicted XRE-type DNA-binding protein